MKNVLLFGVTGQDGSYMVDYLLKNTDHIIYGVERRLSSKNRVNISHNLDNPRFIMTSGDLLDSHSIDIAFKTYKPDYCINFAAQSFVYESWVSPSNTMQVNCIGVINILEALRKHTPQCRFLNMGSSEQFGDIQYSPQDINHPFRSRSIYGASKVAAHQVVKVYKESYDLYCIQPICFNHESERRGEEFITRKITKGVARIKKALELGQEFEPIELGNLDAKRDWSHASDFVDGIWRMLNQDSYRDNINDLINEFDRSGHILLPRGVNPSWHDLLVRNLREYILASGETHSIREFCEKAFHAAGIKNVYWFKEDKAQHECLWLQGMDDMGKTIQEKLVTVNPRFYRPADVEHLCGDSTAARQELGWKPQISFKELVKRMVVHDINLA